MIVSADPGDDSAIRPHMMRVANVRDLKAMHGNADEQYEQGLMAEHHEIPDEWPAEKNDLRRQTISPEDRAAVHAAHQVFLYGNSKHVASYEDVINNVEYPKVIPVFAAQSLSITAANSPYVIKPPESGHIFGVVTIYAGGSIALEGTADFHCQKLVQSDAAGPG